MAQMTFHQVSDNSPVLKFEMIPTTMEEIKLLTELRDCYRKGEGQFNLTFICDKGIQIKETNSE